jgi:GTP-binding protein HflX
VLAKPTLLVLNKTDLLTEPEIDKLRGRFPEAVFMSAGTGEGQDDLLEGIARQLSKLKVEVTLEIPFDRGELVSRVHEEGEVMEEDYTENGTKVIVRLPREALGDLQAFMTSPPEGHGL